MEVKNEADFVKFYMHNTPSFNMLGLCEMCHKPYALWLGTCPNCLPVEYIAT